MGFLNLPNPITAIGDGISNVGDAVGAVTSAVVSVPEKVAEKTVGTFQDAVGITSSREARDAANTAAEAANNATRTLTEQNAELQEKLNEKSETPTAEPVSTSVAEVSERTGGAENLSKVLVGEGQTLSGIASEHGKSIDDLMAANPEITSADQISIGQEINLGEPVLEAAGGVKEKLETSLPEVTDQVKAVGKAVGELSM